MPLYNLTQIHQLEPRIKEFIMTIQTNRVYFFSAYRFVTIRTLLSIILGILLGRFSVASATTIEFNNGLQGPFITYTESNFTVVALSDRWDINTSYGNPSPFILFNRQANENTITAGIQVTERSSRFSFSSVDLYSSITPIPYVINGLLDSNVVFTVAGTVPNTFGSFTTLLNPNSTDIIDTLEITLSNPSTPCCDNPMGLDNIVVTTVSSIPEPDTLTLLILGLTGFTVIRWHKAMQASLRHTGLFCM